MKDLIFLSSRKKWSEEKGRFLCCALAGHHCRTPCRGQSCTATCTLNCGFFAYYSCAPMTCQVWTCDIILFWHSVYLQAANPTGCIASTACPAGWTASASSSSKCFKVCSQIPTILSQQLFNESSEGEYLHQQLAGRLAGLHRWWGNPGQAWDCSREYRDSDFIRWGNRQSKLTYSVIGNRL